MYMEPQTAVAKYDEGGVIHCTSSTQSADHCQWAISAALGIPNNKVNVTCRRAGGGFGGKFSRSRPAATAVSVAAYKLKRQVCLLALEADKPIASKDDLSLSPARLWHQLFCLCVHTVD